MAAIPSVQDRPSSHAQDDFRLASKPAVRPPSLLSGGYLGVSLQVKRSGYETCQFLLASQFNHTWIYTFDITQVDLYLHFPTLIYGIVLNKGEETTLPCRFSSLYFLLIRTHSTPE